MNRQKELLSILLVSFLASIMLGMLDYETESLVHLLTSDPGNWIALLLYTGAFTLLGIMLLGFFRGIRSLVR
ncbi:MAG: hypothetical protein KTR30_17190 [Saprospiraceae bacterium]|nr:hypothetical protein [Saprospiraceae bacterium]